jgi:hypothetical protein
LVFAMAILPWGAASQIGERAPASSGAVPNASPTLEAFTWMPVVPSDRPSTLFFVRRTDGTNPPSRCRPASRSAHPSGLAWETWLASPTARIVPLALHLAGRGPPLLAAA